MRRSHFQNSEDSNNTGASRNRESRWDPTLYKPSEFYGQLAKLFGKLRQGLGSQLDRYLSLLRQFSKHSLSTYELSVAVEKLLPRDLQVIHGEFVQILSESCQLSTVSRSVEDILMGKKSRELKRGHIPHISSINALLILRSLENGWAAPDSTAGQIIGEAVKTMLADRIDAAVHVRKNPSLNGIGFRSDFQPLFSNGIERKHSLHQITTADLFESFTNSNHFLGAETPNLLRMKCHSDFYEKLKSTLVKTETTGGQTMPANTSLVQIPQSECVEEVTVFESFCNVSCVAAYANISIPTVSNFSVFSGPSPASRAKMSTTVRPKTQVSRRSPSRVHWDSDITTISDTEHYTSVLTSSSKDKRMKRKRMDASESSPDEVSIMKVTSRKSAKLESGAQSPTYVNLSSSESVSDDTEVTPTVKRHSISPTLTGRKYRFPLHSELSARDRSLRAGHSRSKKVVTIEISSDEDMVDEEEPYTIPETQLASESRKLIKTMESSISKPRSRTAHPVKPAAVSLLDKGAIQKAQAIIEAWRSSSYEVVPDEIDFSAIESTVHSKTAASKSRRSLFSSTDSIPTSADLSERPESSQSKTPRARTQRHTRTLPSKETNMTDSVQETAERSSYPLQKGDIFLTPKNPRHKNSGEGGTPSSQSTAPFKSAESSQKTYHTETSARLSSSESHDDSQIHRPRAGRPRKMTEPLAAKEIDSTHPSKSGGNIPHSKRDSIRSSEPRDPSADRELEKAPEAPTPQRGLPSTNLLPSSETQRVAESLRGRGKDRKKLAESVGVKGLDSAHGGRSASPASSPEQGGQRSPEARTNLSGMHSTSRLSSSETQDDSLTQKLRGRGRRKLTESAGAKLPRSARPTKSAKSISHEKVDRTSESPASSPERMPRKSQGKLSSQEEAGPLLSQGVSSLRTQNDSQARRPRECTTSSKLTPKNLAEETSKGRKQDKPRRTTSSDGVDPNFSLEPESHGQKAKVKEHTELRGTSDAARKGSGSSKSESRRIPFADQSLPEMSQHDEVLLSRASLRRAPAGKDEPKATRTLRFSSQSSGGEDVAEAVTAARSRPRNKAGNESMNLSPESSPSLRRVSSEDKGRRRPKKNVEAPHLSGDEGVEESAKSRKKSLRQRDR